MMIGREGSLNIAEMMDSKRSANVTSMAMKATVHSITFYFFNTCSKTFAIRKADLKYALFSL